ncbi:MAG: RNA methyltransferase [Paracoccaceae bacterium]|nr:tRNA/rRNA methyltransferase (SpoU) [Rhodobacteraceae bacterium HTCC2150]MDG1531671.1 RNA methyltransferase [Paracoccaceae bacterium]
MAGTDHSEAPKEWAGPQPSIILVRPQMGENIGAAARAMWNFGLERMRIVDPRDGWPNPKATAMASGAAQVMDNVSIYDDTRDAVADCNYVFATTARGRDLTKPIMSPEAAMKHTRDLMASGQKVGILFGPERAGLENDDISRANAIISVPVNPAFASLNLGQCVLLLSYEYRRLANQAPSELFDLSKTRWAEAKEVESLQDHFEEKLEEAHFFFPEHKAAHLKKNLRNMLSRLPLTINDVGLFHGILRALTRPRDK